MKKILCLISLFLLGVTLYASPITGLLERIDKGASRKFVIERLKGKRISLNWIRRGIKSWYAVTTMSALPRVSTGI